MEKSSAKKCRSIDLGVGLIPEADNKRLTHCTAVLKIKDVLAKAVEIGLLASFTHIDKNTLTRKKSNVIVS